MLKQTILDDLKSAMKAGDTAKRDTLRMLDSMVKNVEIEKQKRETGLTDEEVLEVIGKAVKQRRDASAQYLSGGRADLVEKENQEIEILMAYM
ncbi:MAG: GatB/YqeY domain-containing protein, partial [Candidatus Moraniibacteriota bacterium]